jgi:hypothetical protein
MSVVILGLAAYRRDRVWNNVELLVRSVRSNSADVDVMLLTTRLGERDRRLLGRHRVQPLEVVEALPNHNLKTTAGREAMHRWSLEMFGVRHRLYLDALNELPHTHILLSDTRDVIVTNDLNAACAEAKLVFSQEDASRRLGEEPYNRRWILEGYGQTELDRIGNRPILCAGTVFGPRSAVVDYVRAMKAEVERVGVEMTRTIGDQPLHNHLAYSNKLPDFITSRAEDGWLRSIGVMPTSSVRMDWAPGHPASSAGAPGIIHQYDRHLAAPAIRKAAGNVAGLGAWHPWRLHAFQEHAPGLAARIVRKAYWHIPALRR